jgi:predicted oxidoreductase
MRIAGRERASVETLIRTALDLGVNFFDHADIYGRGESEAFFGTVYDLKTPASREKVIVQSKCGIVPGKYYDFSKAHILEAVDGSLKRLNTAYLDILLLHRPDNLMEPEEIQEAFTALHESGKVRAFGVSNFSAMTIELLKTAVTFPVVANQMQYSPVHAYLTSESTAANTARDDAASRSGGLLEYCRIHGIRLQAWSPFQYGDIKGVYVDNPAYAAVNAALQSLADKYGITKTGAVAAWIARHPAGIQLVAGTTGPDRLKEIVAGAGVTVTRQEWYDVLAAGGSRLA